MFLIGCHPSFFLRYRKIPKSFLFLLVSTLLALFGFIILNRSGTVLKLDDLQDYTQMIVQMVQTHIRNSSKSITYKEN